MDIPQFFNPFACWWIFGVFLGLALTIQNKAVMDICVEFVYGHMISCPLSKYLVVEWLDCMVGVCLSF